MTTKTQHTATPWKVDSMALSGRVITDSLGDNIAEITSDKLSARDNASFIVKAVNNHASLLEACRSARLAMESCNAYKGYLKSTYEKLCIAIHDAI